MHYVTFDAEKTKLVKLKHRTSAGDKWEAVGQLSHWDKSDADSHIETSRVIGFGKTQHEALISMTHSAVWQTKNITHRGTNV